MYRLIAYHYGRVIDELKTDDYEKAKDFFYRRGCYSSCVRVYVHDRRLRLCDADKLFGWNPSRILPSYQRSY